MKIRKPVLILFLGVLLLAVAGGVLAQADLPLAFDISWFTIDGGGGASSGGAYSLNGTIGQADAGSMSGGAYTLQGGFWVGAAGPAMLYVYLPIIKK